MKHTWNVSRLVVAAVTTGCLLTCAPAVWAVPQAPQAPRTPQAPQTPRSPEQTDVVEVPTTEDYRLGPGDKLRIEVYKDLQLSQSAQIRPDGKITMPLVGDIMASGKTPAELRDVITTALKEYMTNPVVTVIVVEATVATAYVMGEVNQPGAVPLQRRVTVLQALALAGGLTEFAKSNDIHVLRETGEGVEAIAFDYKDALKGSAEAQMYLRSGDTIVVP